MSKAEKLLARFLSRPADFTYDELKRLLGAYGYEQVGAGKTAGSRVTFVNQHSMHIIKLHRPHPSPCMKRYQLAQVEEVLRRMEVIK